MELLKKTLNQLLSKGAEKAQLVFSENHKQEFNVEANEISLLRTNITKSLSLRVIKDGKQGRLSINKVDELSLSQAVEDVLSICAASPVDNGYDISSETGKFSFSSGKEEVKPEEAYNYLKAYLQQSQKEFPQVQQESVMVSYDYSKVFVVNTNGLLADINSGQYSVSNMFTAKEGERTSSFNFTGFLTSQLDVPLMEKMSTRKLLNESVLHLDAKPIGQKFNGDIIVTPHALTGFFLGGLLSHLRDGRLIDGSSYFKDKLGQNVLSSRLGIQVYTCDPRFAVSAPMTSDGFISKDYSIFNKGRLDNYLLSQYGSNKTGLGQTYNDGGLIEMSAGEMKLEQMIKNTKKGLVVARISAGAPGANGDFSGVAKNSFYVENGEVKYPIKETMISGNLFEMFNSMSEVSQEVLNNGSAILPWVKFTGVSVSG